MRNVLGPLGFNGPYYFLKHKFPSLFLAIIPGFPGIPRYYSPSVFRQSVPPEIPLTVPGNLQGNPTGGIYYVV